MINWEQTLISQYANSPTLTAWIDSFNLAMDPSTNISSFLDKVWNVATAVGYGLDIWGRIVGISRVLQLPASGNWAEFNEQGAGSDAFGTLPLYSGLLVTTNYSMDDESYRRAILAKAFANITRCSIPNLNKSLMLLFPGRGNAYMKDLGGMGMQAYFTFLLIPFEVTLLKTSGIVLPPSGVAFTITDSSGPR